MKNKLTIGGHAWKRHFFYTSGNSYHELYAPGGAAMLAAILGDLAAPLTLPEGSLCEHIQLVKSSAKNVDSFYIGAHAGWAGGNSAVKMSSGEAALIWDEGFGDITVPADIPVLWASKAVLPTPEITKQLKGRCLLMLDVDVLRRNSAMISRQVSWERSATDLVWQLANNPALNYLHEIEHILITFAEDGAVYMKHDDKGFTPTLVLTHGGAEGMLCGQIPGAMPDAWTVMVAGVAVQLQNVIRDKKPLLLYHVLKAAESLIKTGYDSEILESGEYKQWLAMGSEIDDKYAYQVPVCDPILGADPHFWCIGSEAQGKKISHVAFEYVMDGSCAIEGLPRLSFGALTTIDRREIEAFQNIKNLIVEYAAVGKVSRPLSMAVFGALGSGKSFGVTQIAENVLPGLVEKLEFNISQFTDIADLTAVFHQVRDIILAGKLPLIFLDEFDSDRGGQPLGWIKSFLMPMQYGKFKDASGEHPVGKCIFVFSGGTTSSFEDFCKPMQAGDAARKRFKEAKGPDFVSHLRGTINVLGPNPVGKDDQNYILRRALLLRSLFERKFFVESGKMTISDSVLRAMLLVPNYKHGARSIEAILDMSRIDGATWEPASLPFKDQLSLHVDADVFIRLVLNEVRLNSFTEKLAKAIHDDFFMKQTERGDTGPYVIPWENLPEGIQEENRRQARSISKKLNAVLCDYDAGDTPYPSVKEFIEDEILVLARMEHDLWMASKAAAGYIYGPKRNDKPFDKKGNRIPLTHPYMLPWEKLDQDTQQKDIDTIHNIIPLLESVGLRVYRTV